MTTATLPACVHPKCGCGGLCDSGHPCPMAQNAGPLCRKCRADHDADPAAWLEYGDHPAGIANWEALKAEMAAAQDPTPAEAWDGIPF